MNSDTNIIVEKSFSFALEIIQVARNLYKSNEYVLSKQLLKSGTSIGANVRESQNAESKADFIHKMSIAQKECDETLYWLELLWRSDAIRESEFKILRDEAQSILKILRSIILSTKQNQHKR